MKLFGIHRVRNQRGFTLIEVIVAALITAIIAAATFSFYVTTHNEVLTQVEISDMQQITRVTLQEISGSLRNAGYKLDTHPAYQISGDSLFVFASMTQPVDTVLYYLEEFDTAEYTRVQERPNDLFWYKVMKKVNSDSANIFSDFIADVNFTAIDSSTVEVEVVSMVSKPDETFNDNQGFRQFGNTERVTLRNVGLSSGT